MSGKYKDYFYKSGQSASDIMDVADDFDSGEVIEKIKTDRKYLDGNNKNYDLNKERIRNQRKFKQKIKDNENKK